MPTWPAARARARDGARRRPPEAIDLAACEISAICTFSTTVIEPKVAATWKVRPTPRRQMSRGGRPAMLRPQRISPASAQLAVDHVEAGRLAGAVRARSARGTRLRDVELTPSTALHAAEGFRRVATDRELAHRGSQAAARDGKRADDAAGKASTRRE
jgi:hypothetical protein